MEIERSCNSSIIHISHSSLNHKGICWWPFNSTCAPHLLGSDTSVKWPPVSSMALKLQFLKTQQKNIIPYVLVPTAHCPEVPRLGLAMPGSGCSFSCLSAELGSTSPSASPSQSQAALVVSSPLTRSYTDVC